MIERLIQAVEDESGQPEAALHLAVKLQFQGSCLDLQESDPARKDRMLSLIKVFQDESGSLSVKVFAPAKENGEGTMGGCMLEMSHFDLCRGLLGSALLDQGLARKEDIPPLLMYLERFFRPS